MALDEFLRAPDCERFGPGVFGRAAFSEGGQLPGQSGQQTSVQPDLPEAQDRQALTRLPDAANKGSVVASLQSSGDGARALNGNRVTQKVAAEQDRDRPAPND